ncbi:MAG TPA: alkaline phosphatase family protein [Longimicrobiales bacterium]
MPRVLLLFLDGVGLGTDDSRTNPFANASLPTLHDLLGLRTITADAAPHHGPAASLVAVDATLGMPGIPQSGTGQAALLTGVDTVELNGRHFGPWVPARLRHIVRDASVLARARAAGFTTAFANAYPEEVTRLANDTPLPSDAPSARGRARRAPAFLRAGPPLAALGAGLLTRHTTELERGDAVASEITNEAWRERLGRAAVPSITARHAGRNLAHIALAHDLTLFAHYTTDYAGHRQEMAAAVAALERVDAFIAGLVTTAGDELLTFIVSDHGNVEDVSTGHTRNPALGIVIGRTHTTFARRLTSLLDVAPAVLDALRLG